MPVKPSIFISCAKSRAFDLMATVETARLLSRCAKIHLAKLSSKCGHFGFPPRLALLRGFSFSNNFSSFLHSRTDVSPTSNSRLAALFPFYFANFITCNLKSPVYDFRLGVLRNNKVKLWLVADRRHCDNRSLG